MTDDAKTNMIERPSYLADADVIAENADLNMYARPPRIKIVQGMTGPPIKPPFAEGDIVVLPNLLKIGDADMPFVFVPIHFFPSWICLNPIQLRGQLQSIREFSMDATSEVAKKCKAFTKERCPENPEYYLKFNETLNFMVVVEGVPELKDVPIHIFFSSGEYKTGQKFIGDIQLRKAPRYACRFRAASGPHVNTKGQSWQGLEIFNDSQPWVEEDAYHKYKKFHEDLKQLVDSRSVELDLSDFDKTDGEQGGNEF